jgi:glycosyltransferase involved in cell wall biosynthesis
MKIAVIMPCKLSHYDGCATNRVQKFHRAVESFLKQNYNNKQLVIVSDGCAVTNEEYYKHYNLQNEILLVQSNSHKVFSGNVRQQGIDNTKAEIICYLDSDDFFGENNHLQNIVTVFETNMDLVWFYMNDYLGDGVFLDGIKKTKIEHGSIGTSSIAHQNKSDISWAGCDGYGHDFSFVSKMYALYPKPIKENVGSYRICHIPNLFDI